MAIIRHSEIVKMNEKEREEKLKDLKLELIKSNVAANKTNSKTKEIKKAISRILTIKSQTFSKSKDLPNK